MKKKKKNTVREISKFGMLSLEIMGRLIMSENVDDNIIDLLRDMELEYDSLLKKNEILEERVNIDEKTSLLKYNENFLVNIVKTASRYWEHHIKSHFMSISYLRIDLDDFSMVNNAHGHETGDKVLKAVSESMKKASRPTDYLFRFGGEEFDIVLPATPLDGAEVYTRKLLDSIRKVKVTDDHKHVVPVTASIGLTSFEVDLSSREIFANKNLVKVYHNAQKHSDRACYMAKYDGKDCYRIYDPSVDYEAIMEAYAKRHLEGKD